MNDPSPEKEKLIREDLAKIMSLNMKGIERKAILPSLRQKMQRSGSPVSEPSVF
jgi:hypothetical protein